MAYQKPRAMDEYLRPTELCDCNNAKLKQKAKQIIKGAVTPREVASRIFYFVRDEIPFGWYYLDAKASSTLKKRIGRCTTKTNLQMALLRAVGIPARCHYARVKKEAIKDITSRFSYHIFPMVIGHLWCECYLSRKWVACDAVFDEALFKGMFEKGVITKGQIPTIDWDGQTDLILPKPWIVEDLGTFPSFEAARREIIKRREEKAMLPTIILDKLFGWLIFPLSNRQVNKVRKR